jgi:hypothetical protein
MKRLTLAVLPLILLSMSSPRIRADFNKDITDGPYIMYTDSKMYVNYITKENGANVRSVDSMSLSDRAGYVIKVATENPGKTFDVKLKSKLQVERSEWGKPKKQLVISDIEGNFAAFRKLLVANKVIDDQFNWIFEEGHLLLVGDFVDRGSQVTEVLWLIYSLEDKARAAGGYVHYVLGNHEIMNLSGDLRYLHPKYVEAASLMNKHFVELYGESSELGRWFRTKNVAEKVGNILYVHGGISPLVYRVPFDVPMINKLTRPFYADSVFNYPDLETEILYSDYGPFWYRGMYRAGDPKSIEKEVDSSLMRFNSNHIVTGHTVVSDTVSMWFKGKVFNTDTHHAKGHSQGLLIEGGDRFYRVDANGNRFFMIKK